MAQTKVKLISDGVIVQGNLHASHGITTAHISEGSNLYYTDARVGSYLSTNSFATESYVGTQIANLVDSSPGALNTLNELAAALGDDANFSTTVTNSIALKAPLASPTFTGNVNGVNLIASSGVYSSTIYSNATTFNIKNNSSADYLSFDASKNATFAGNVITENLFQVYSTGASVIIGAIGNTANDVNIYSTTSGHNGLRMHVNGILPTDHTGTIINNDADLGDPSYRFKDLYLGGSITAGGGATFAGNVINNGDITISSTSPELKIVDTNSFTDTNDRWIVRGGADTLIMRWYDNSASSNTDALTLLPNLATFYGAVKGTIARFDTLNNSANSANIIYRSGTDTIVGGGSPPNKIYVQDGGDVGIGQTGPSFKLDVNGTGYFADLLRVDEPVYSYTNSGTKHYTHLATGSLYGSGASAAIITTNIPGHNISGNGNMFSFKIVGYAYGMGIIDMTVGLYAGENNFYSAYWSGTCQDNWIGNVYVFTNSAGATCIQLGEVTDALNCEIAVTDFVQGFGNVNANYSKGWSIAAVTTLPTQNQKTTLNYKTILPDVYEEVTFHDKVGIGVTSPLGKLHVGLPAYTSEDTNSQQAIFGASNGYGVRIGYNETDNKGYINVVKPGVAWGSLILQREIGKVGIGTTSPSEILHVNKNATSRIVGAYFTNSQANTGAEAVSIAFGLNRSGGDFVRKLEAIEYGAENQWTGTPSTVNSYLAFNVLKGESAFERMRVNSLGVDVTSHGAHGVHLKADSADTNNSGRLLLTRVGGSGWAIMNNSTNFSIRSGSIAGSTSGTEKIRLTGYSATSWTSGSDETIKENIKPIGNVLDKINDYRCVEYNLIDDETKDKKIGFIAQDWQEDFPQIIEQMENEKIGMKYTETIPILLKAIQELKADNDSLKARIETLENN